MTKRSPLAVHRFAAGFTQQETADRVGLSRKAIVALESGQHRPRWLTATALSDVLGVPVDQLFPDGTYGAHAPAEADRGS